MYPKRHPSVGAILSSKTARSVLISLLAFITLFGFACRFSGLWNVHASWGRKLASPEVDLNDPTIKWSQFAYVQYVTNEEYLCNSVMLFEALHRLRSRPDRVMFYPSPMLEDPHGPMPSIPNHNATLLIKARDEYNVTLIPIDVLSRNTTDGNLPPISPLFHVTNPLPPPPETWCSSFTKLLAFNLTTHARVLSLDSDALLLHPPDELFLLPPSPVAMPLAYWLLPQARKFSSYILLIQPSPVEFARVMDAVRSAAPGEYDMEVLNDLYGGIAMVLPHRRYGLLTKEFRGRRGEHGYYLGSAEEEWDAMRVLEEAKYVHFSDWPMTKPWVPMSAGLKAMMQPGCWEGEGESWERRCVERDVWNWLYGEFREGREVSCLT